MPGRNDFGILSAAALTDPRFQRLAARLVEEGLAVESTAEVTARSFVVHLGLWAARDSSDGVLPGDGVRAFVLATAVSDLGAAAKAVAVLREEGIGLLRERNGGLYLAGFEEAYGPLIRSREWARERSRKRRSGDPDGGSRDDSRDRSRDDSRDRSRDRSRDDSRDLGIRSSMSRESSRDLSRDPSYGSSRDTSRTSRRTSTPPPTPPSPGGVGFSATRETTHGADPPSAPVPNKLSPSPPGVADVGTAPPAGRPPPPPSPADPAAYQAAPRELHGPDPKRWPFGPAAWARATRLAAAMALPLEAWGRTLRQNPAVGPEPLVGLVRREIEARAGAAAREGAAREVLGSLERDRVAWLQGLPAERREAWFAEQAARYPDPGAAARLEALRRAVGDGGGA